VPIYEYQCENCGYKFDKLQRMSDAVLKDCPECHQSQLRKLISSTGFQLKGNGWYVTDFKNSGGATNNKSTKETPEKSASVTPTKTQSS